MKHNKNKKIIISNLMISIVLFSSCVLASTSLYNVDIKSNIIIDNANTNNYPTDADGVIIIDDPWYYATLDDIKFPTAKSTETSPMVVLDEKQLQTLRYAYNDKGTTKWTMYEPNHKISNKTIISPELDNNEIINDIKYIRYTESVVNVDDYYEWYLSANGKWQLIVKSSDLITTFAKNGFYKINNNIYYIDDEGYMVTGMMKDERGYIYILDDNGVLISKKKGD